MPLSGALLRATRVVLALVLASCASRAETEVLVVVVPIGFASAAEPDASAPDAGLAALGTVVIEARPLDSPPVCDSRFTSSTTAAIVVDGLHRVSSGVYTLAVVPAHDAPLRITVWGKVAGLDRARRSFVVRPVTGRQRVLCVALPPDVRDCQCADMEPAIEILGGQRGVDTATADCVALVRAGTRPRGIGVSAACDAASFVPTMCLGVSAGAASEQSCGSRETGVLDAGRPDATAVDAGGRG